MRFRKEMQSVTKQKPTTTVRNFMIPNESVLSLIDSKKNFCTRTEKHKDVSEPHMSSETMCKIFN